MKNKNLFNIIIIIIIIFLVILLFEFFKLYIKKLNNKITKNIEIVISRYNENLEWLKYKPYNKFSVIIYNKGTNNNFYKPPLLKKIINLPNVGVCDHTYLYHIINNYNNLAEITIFLPGSCMNFIKKIITTNVINKTIENNNTVIYSNYVKNGIINYLYDFKLDNWNTSNSENKKLNNDSILRKCDITPFGNWYKKNFNNLNINYITYFGIFSISK